MYVVYDSLHVYECCVCVCAKLIKAFKYIITPPRPLAFRNQAKAGATKTPAHFFDKYVGIG